MTKPPTDRKRKKIDPSNVFAAVFLLAVAIAIPMFVWRTCSGTSPLREETRAFFGLIRSGKTEAAYEALASTRRRELTPQAFVALLDRPILREFEEIDIDGTQSRDDRAGCTRGELALGDREWTFQAYLEKEGDKWRVHTWVLQEPATMVRMNVLDQCLQW